MTLVAIFITLIFLHSLVSARIERTVVTAPIVFTTAGMLVLVVMPELRDRKGSLDLFLCAAEAGLAGGVGLFVRGAVVRGDTASGVPACLVRDGG